ncbi:S-adenosyl-L-methionine-dependent methyltransferase [Pyrenochaeta sp. MPI-SDFR-AT-0127]|nr:S-adenosyl-L-methionine-dependent methyltransferase [Pyrenochaeta sp. MPI-SDFR-AT-0127]
MTQPTSVNMTFDTSLVDLNPNASFSTTESDPSDIGTLNLPSKTPKIQQPSLFEEQSQDTPKQSQTLSSSNSMPPPKVPTPVQHIPTQDAYDQWASIYDSDGNMLQSIDDLELTTLLPDFLGKVSSNVQNQEISVLDLGCGTGRNTAKLLSYSWPQNSRISVTGLDFSKGMLDVAAQKLRPFVEGSVNEQSRTELRLECSDCFPTVSNPAASPLPAVPNLTPVNGVISTLVLEHIPLRSYFSTLSSLLQPNGIALVTNMHADMGRVSQAGFINAEGVKVRGSSFAFTVEETVAEARKAGFEIVSVKERSMTKEDVESGLVGERGWKWVGINVWYGMVLRKVV